MASFPERNLAFGWKSWRPSGSWAAGLGCQTSSDFASGSASAFAASTCPTSSMATRQCFVASGGPPLYFKSASAN